MRSFRFLLRGMAAAAIVVLAARGALAADGPMARAEGVDPPKDDPAKTASPSDDAKIEELEQRVKILERQREIESEQAAEKAKNAPQSSVGKDGFTLRSADGAFVLKIRGYVQTDGRNWEGDEQRPTASAFLLRRARPILEGTLYKYFDFRIMPDFGQGASSIQDAYMEARFKPWLRFRAGKYKPPVGLERLQSATNMIFAERALPTNLVPNRDIGFQVSGDLMDGAVTYAAGAFNGAADGSSADTDTDDGKDGEARLFLLPFKKSRIEALEGLGIGVSGTSGSARGTPAATGLAPYRTAGQQSFFAYRSDLTPAGTVVARGDRARLSPQAWYYWRRIGLMAEKVTATQRVALDTVEADMVHRSWQVTGSFLLTDDKASYSGVSPKKAFDPPTGGWGAVELAARYSELSVDRDAFPVFANPATQAREARAWGAGVNWYLNRSVKLMLDWEHTTFEGGSATGDREDEKVAFARFQVAF